MSALAEALTEEQARAAGSADARVFVEAGPGSGKTVVASTLFGVQRFARVAHGDRRAVVAVSFTRSATAELRARIVRDWGPATTRLPHRTCTLDTLINEIVGFLLTSGEVTWPGGHTELDVIDDWKTVAPGRYGFTGVRLALRAGAVVPEEFLTADRETHLTLRQYREAIRGGVCSHNDVRQVLTLFLADPDGRETVKRWFGSQYRALIVDEAFDANPLDLELLRLAADAHVKIFIIGDPWQALYAFRKAVPDQVLAFLDEYGFTSQPLTASFRFRTDPQKHLAERLRAGLGVDLAVGSPSACDVVLAHRWKELWDASDAILPIAFTQRSSGSWAVTTLVLHAALMYLHGTPALHIKEALRIAGAVDGGQQEWLLGNLSGVAARLAMERESAAITEAWDYTVGLVNSVNATFTSGNRMMREMKGIRRRLRLGSRPTLGLTVHQAKGREWDRVGVVLSSGVAAKLASGLKQKDEGDRVVYVALTRARDATVLIADQEAFAIAE